jgi:hypothetical protein
MPRGKLRSLPGPRSAVALALGTAMTKAERMEQTALQIEGLVGHIAALERANLPRGADSARDLLERLTNTLAVKRDSLDVMRTREAGPPR